MNVQKNIDMLNEFDWADIPDLLALCLHSIRVYSGRQQKGRKTMFYVSNENWEHKADQIEEDYEIIVQDDNGFLVFETEKEYDEYLGESF